MNINEWIKTLPPLDYLDFLAGGKVEIAAERLGVTPESLVLMGCDDYWFSNPENMPPPPGSWRWVSPGHPLWDALNGEGE